MRKPLPLLIVAAISRSVSKRALRFWRTRNDKALAAFRFANRAMAQQRVHGLFALSRRRGENKTLADFESVKIARGDRFSSPSSFSRFRLWPTRPTKTAPSRSRPMPICSGFRPAEVRPKPIWESPHSRWPFAGFKAIWEAMTAVAA